MKEFIKPYFGLIIILSLLIGVGFFFIEGIFHYNRLSSWNTTIECCKANIEKELQRRNNLIIHIFKQVNKYTLFEEKIFKSTSKSRDWMKNSQVADKIKSLEKAAPGVTLSSLVAIAEEYPELQATILLQDLIKEISDCENRIARMKEKFNSSVGSYNQCRTTFPGNFYGFFLFFPTMEYMGNEEEMIKVPVIR
ncbi:MAG: LemA family protein [Candidatus Riflebacteria bacterium]|nr:LemA family protein [Candidatus Riflebacteria bacterium]